MHVSRFSIAPVKGMGLAHPDEITLGRHGAAGDRRFYLVDDAGRLVNGKVCGELIQVRAETDAEGDRLELTFPGGRRVGGGIELGAQIETSFYGRPVGGRLLEGHWSEALSEHAGRRLRLVRADEPGGGIDRVHVVSLVSDGSLRALGRRAGVDDVDGRRFRMTIEVGSCGEHEEDSWIGGEVRVGAALVRVVGPVGRCAVTTLDPDTGVSNLDTLGVLAGYRELREGKAFAFGVCGDVVEEGVVRVGDPVQQP